MQEIELQKKKKISKNAIIEWIYELWYSDSVIANETIINSLKYSGISNLLDEIEVC